MAIFCASVVRCESQETRANTTSQELEESGYSVAEVHVIHDIIAQGFDCSILQVERDSDIVLSGAKCECLWS